MDIITRYAPHPDQRTTTELERGTAHAIREINFI